MPDYQAPNAYPFFPKKKKTKTTKKDLLYIDKSLAEFVKKKKQKQKNISTELVKQWAKRFVHASTAWKGL